MATAARQVRGGTRRRRASHTDGRSARARGRLTPRSVGRATP